MCVCACVYLSLCLSVCLYIYKHQPAEAAHFSPCDKVRTSFERDADDLVLGVGICRLLLRQRVARVRGEVPAMLGAR